ncbi:uncharacterized protein AKAW2_50397S [Aspergillus luchuensis]|uniref:Uncharacterized protein n=1 Tax=Aspergillus kawachii TaxID=1069201 RepID=A0A7R7ZZ48_ASPKA|nr:uncharacterized protein AKAW2_50082A [Aspergillus luchuensis]XP_041543818.1 uncharacterized protein AKAW2_50397S [Aspergillus luchuensis]BCR99740.1 hypothetical protein AKAW2_50082A [Aspergillus luchuensis]BCS00056.1 hypothetical protein AKAW2_50397S [Aspergillus luchuensis]GAA93184.1 hypothetical protein AKAW_11296 [Aspergillus luchuensis IFO 4308]
MLDLRDLNENVWSQAHLIIFTFLIRPIALGGKRDVVLWTASTDHPNHPASYLRHESSSGWSLAGIILSVLSVLYIVALRRDKRFIRHKLPSAELEERLLRTLTFYSPSPFRIQAIAVLPHDSRVTKNWLLIELLCHRVFAALPDQGTIRQVSSSYHARASPGDVLLITAYPVTQSSFRWLEATITKGNELMATVTALYDGPVLGGTADMRRRD